MARSRAQLSDIGESRVAWAGHLRHLAMGILKPSAAVGLALLIGAGVIWAMGEDPIFAYQTLFNGAFKGAGNFVATLQYTTPLLFTGLAVSFAFRAGVANIGVEGQMLFGALAAGIVGYTISAPPFLHVALAMIAAAVAGAVWAFIPAILRARLGVNELVVCLMLNPIALLLTGYFSSYPLKAPGPTNKTYDILASAQLQQFTNSAQLNTGFILALVLLAVFWVIENRTGKGYEWKLVGQNPLFARYGGIGVQKSIIGAFLVSGMVAGLAGAEQVLGVYRAFYNGFSPGYGFDGIAVAMLAKNSPIGVAFAALLLGALNSGGIVMQMMTSVTRDLVKMLEAVIILLLAADFAITSFKARRKVAKAGTAGKSIGGGQA